MKAELEKLFMNAFIILRAAFKITEAGLRYDRSKIL
jgi:hypothetical protein